MNFLRVLEDFDSVMKTPKRLSVQEEETLRMDFGREISLPVTPPKKTDSPIQSIEKAGAYVLKQARKGLVDLDSNITSPKQVFKDSLIPVHVAQREQKIIRQRDITFTDEEFQKFWQSTAVVTKCVKEITALPYYDPFDMADCESKFRESVGNVVRKMHDAGLLDERKQTQRKLYNIMHDFVVKVGECRVSVIRWYLKAEKIEWKKLTDKQKQEFPEFAPPEPQHPVPDQTPKKDSLVKQKEIDERILKRVYEEVGSLPSSYRIDEFVSDSMMSTQARLDFERDISAAEKVMTNAMSNRPAKPNLPPLPMPQQKPAPQKPVGTGTKRGVSVLSSITKKPAPPRGITSRAAVKTRPKRNSDAALHLPAYDLFWDECDPLKATRAGTSRNPLSKMREITHGFDFNRHAGGARTSRDDMDLHSESNAVMLGSRLDRIFSTSVFHAKADNDNEDAPMTTAQDVYDIDRRGPSDVKYLTERTEDMDDTCGEAIYQRLDRIWERLGFSIMQKLDMAIKYSSSTEESGRLAEAVNYWETAFSAVSAYEKSYSMIKDFLRMEAPTSKYKEMTYQVLEADLRTSEANLVENAHRLKIELGDDLVIHRRKVSDLIATRRVKLTVLKESANIQE